jgi:hypothetical protein
MYCTRSSGDAKWYLCMIDLLMQMTVIINNGPAHACYNLCLFFFFIIINIIVILLLLASRPSCGFLECLYLCWFDARVCHVARWWSMDIVSIVILLVFFVFFLLCFHLFVFVFFIVCLSYISVIYTDVSSSNCMCFHIMYMNIYKCCYYLCILLLM